MSYYICFVVSVLFLLIGVITTLRLRNGKNKSALRPVNCLMIAVFFASSSLFYPIYETEFHGDYAATLKTLLISMHNAIRLFIVDGEFDIINDNITSAIGEIWISYSVLAAILFVFAPILTFSVILSLIKNAYAYGAYLFSYFKDVYVFSELNDESIVLASSIKKNHPKAAIVYTDVFESNDEQSYELMQKARKLIALFFKGDIEYINYSIHSRNKKIVFFTIGHDETENIRQAMALIGQYKERDNVELYVFSSTSEGELLLADIDKGSMKVRRINENTAMINRYLYESGDAIFDGAVHDDKNVRSINVMLVGMGKYGTEMLKTLSWFCQMDGYRLFIDAYDRKVDVLDRFTAICPELISNEHNGVFDKNDAEYIINIHSGVDVDTHTFQRMVLIGERETSFVYVALGDDNENVRVSTNLRVMFERKGIHPRIVTIVEDSHVNSGLQKIHNFSGQPYNIDFIGSLEETYSEEAIMGSDLENEALQRHLKWGNEEEFWKYEYNYKSSVATTIHTKMKRHCGIAGADKREEDLTDEEKLSLEQLEHRRWNAYMRSEGYVYSGSPYSESRNNLGKMHHSLIPYLELSEEDKRKDSKVTTL